MKPTSQISKGRLWTSYILQAVVVLLLLMGAVNNILRTEAAVRSATDMGYPESSVLALGITSLVITILYAVPRTTVLGATLVTAWLGGAIASHAIHHDSLPMTLFPVIFGVLVWLSIWLRYEALQQVTPLLK
jgi:hypothetical protein